MPILRKITLNPTGYSQEDGLEIAPGGGPPALTPDFWGGQRRPSGNTPGECHGELPGGRVIPLEIWSILGIPPPRASIVAFPWLIGPVLDFIPIPLGLGGFQERRFWRRAGQFRGEVAIPPPGFYGGGLGGIFYIHSARFASRYHYPGKGSETREPPCNSRWDCTRGRPVKRDARI